MIVGMVAAKHDRQGAGCQDLGDAMGDVGVAGRRIGVDDIGVADVDDDDLAGRQIGDIVLVIVGPCMAIRRG